MLKFQVFKKFTKNCRENYSYPGEIITVDESLLEFHGRCPFKMFIPSKAAKFGIKIYCAVDLESRYMYNAEVYLGKGEEEKHADGESVSFCKKFSQKMISDLLAKNRPSPRHANSSILDSRKSLRQHIYNGHCIVADNFFTSPQLGRSLYEKKTHLLGTVRSNRKGVPKDFVKENIQVRFLLVLVAS